MYLHVDIVSNLESRYIVFSCSSPLHSQTSNLSTVNFQRATVADRQSGAAGRAAASQLQQPEFCLGLRYHAELAHSLCKLVPLPDAPVSSHILQRVWDGRLIGHCKFLLRCRQAIKSGEWNWWECGDNRLQEKLIGSWDEPALTQQLKWPPIWRKYGISCIWKYGIIIH